MPNHPCIFCSKTQNRPSKGLVPSEVKWGRPHPESAMIAIPVFMGRVSPVLDTCSQLELLSPDPRRKSADRTIQFRGASIFDRAGEMKRAGVRMVICGAVGETFYNLLRENGIDLVCGINGDVREVIAAYRSGKLTAEKFRMPGSDQT